LKKKGRLYDTARWKRVRRRQLARELFCRSCAEEGRDELATQVDHIVPLERGGAPFDPENLQSLCATHHSMKTNLFDKNGRDWSEHALVGCFEDGSPRDPDHPWYSGTPEGEHPGGEMNQTEREAQPPGAPSAADLISRADR